MQQLVLGVYTQDGIDKVMSVLLSYNKFDELLVGCKNSFLRELISGLAEKFKGSLTSAENIRRARDSVEQKAKAIEAEAIMACRLYRLARLVYLYGSVGIYTQGVCGLDMAFAAIQSRLVSQLSNEVSALLKNIIQNFPDTEAQHSAQLIIDFLGVIKKIEADILINGNYISPVFFSEVIKKLLEALPENAQKIMEPFIAKLGTVIKEQDKRFQLSPEDVGKCNEQVKLLFNGVGTPVILRRSLSTLASPVGPLMGRPSSVASSAGPLSPKPSDGDTAKPAPAPVNTWKKFLFPCLT